MSAKSKQNIVAIIPARMGSSRFPGKPMAKICGIPMIGHVYNRTVQSKLLSDTYVATCDKEIFDYITSIGGKAVMTSDQHERATDRAAECMEKIEASTSSKIDVVVMVQGDEPLLNPNMIDLAISGLDDNCFCVNLVSPIKTLDEKNDPNEIKVVIGKDKNIIYLSRSAIPNVAKGKKLVPDLKQVCIIPFKRENLLKFNAMEATSLEIAESIDMLRVIENGYTVRSVFSEYETYSVDTLEDLTFVEKIMSKMK